MRLAAITYFEMRGIGIYASEVNETAEWRKNWWREAGFVNPILALKSCIFLFLCQWFESVSTKTLFYRRSMALVYLDHTPRGYEKIIHLT